MKWATLFLLMLAKSTILNVICFVDLQLIMSLTSLNSKWAMRCDKIIGCSRNIYFCRLKWTRKDYKIVKFSQNIGGCRLKWPLTKVRQTLQIPGYQQHALPVAATARNNQDLLTFAWWRHSCAHGGFVLPAQKYFIFQVNFKHVWIGSKDNDLVLNCKNRWTSFDKLNKFAQSREQRDAGKMQKTHIFLMNFNDSDFFVASAMKSCRHAECSSRV